MDLNYVLYASHLTRPLTRLGLSGLLKESQSNNERNEITGFLHIENDIVLQYLEGPPEALLRLIQHIRKDDRHTDLQILDQGALETRHFEGWQMALVENTTLSLFDILGVKSGSVPEVTDANPLDLITLLSANASFLRNSPSQV